MGLFDKLKKSGSKKEDAKKTGKVDSSKAKSASKTKKADKAKGADKKKETKKPVPKKEKREIRPNSKAYRILTKAMITEKGTYLNSINKYIFEVNRGATKPEIKKAIRDIYGVEPLKVNIVNLKGKERTYARISGWTSPRKKAIVTLAEGQTIEVHEGV